METNIPLKIAKDSYQGVIENTLINNMETKCNYLGGKMCKSCIPTHSKPETKKQDGESTIYNHLGILVATYAREEDWGEFPIKEILEMDIDNQMKELNILRYFQGVKAQLLSTQEEKIRKEERERCGDIAHKYYKGCTMENGRWQYWYSDEIINLLNNL